MCKCISNNQPEDWQTDKLVPLKYDDSGIVGIDFCIATTIKHLWDNGIATGGSCCGHNQENPSIVIQKNKLEPAKKEAEKIRKLIAEVDDREWIIYSWILKSI